MAKERQKSRVFKNRQSKQKENENGKIHFEMSEQKRPNEWVGCEEGAKLVFECHMRW